MDGLWPFHSGSSDPAGEQMSGHLDVFIRDRGPAVIGLLVFAIWMAVEQRICSGAIASSGEVARMADGRCENGGV